MSFYARYVLSKKEKRKFVQLLREKLGPKAAEFVGKASRVEIAKSRLNYVIYYADGYPVFFEKGEEVLPTIIGAALGIVDLPCVNVDEGAVPHIVDGADVMAPGITRISKPFGKGELVYVADPKGVVIGIGVALMKSEEILARRRGRAIKNVHCLKDKLWKLYFEPRFIKVLRATSCKP